MFTDPRKPYAAYPELSHFIHAADVRHLVQPTYAIACMFDQGEPEHKHRKLLMKYLCQYYDLLSRNGPIMPPQEVQRLKDAIHHFL
eukprot:5573269-Alexandrium_andersonii.AAC.1